MPDKYGSQIPKFDRLYCRPTKSPAFQWPSLSHACMQRIRRNSAFWILPSKSTRTFIPFISCILFLKNWSQSNLQMKFISSKLHVRRCPLIYISKGNRYLRQSGYSFSFSVTCVREIEKVKIVLSKNKAFRNVMRFSKLLRSAPLSSAKLAKARLRSFASQKCAYHVCYLLSKLKQATRKE